MTIWRVPCIADASGLTQKIYATTRPTLISSSMPESDALMGGITLSNVRRGSAQTASLGYWMGAPYAGRGHMRAAVETLMPVAFGLLRLHRIEAATMLSNIASIRVLESSGFTREGVARAYLKINGRWEDHLLYARVATAPISAAPRQGGGA